MEGRTILAYIILACLLLRLLQPSLDVPGALCQVLDHGFLHGLHSKAQSYLGTTWLPSMGIDASSFGGDESTLACEYVCISCQVLSCSCLEVCCAAKGLGCKCIVSCVYKYTCCDVLRLLPWPRLSCFRSIECCSFMCARRSLTAL